MADIGTTEPQLEDITDPLDEDGEWDEDENYDDEDLDGETEEMAQRLREQLMADINRVNAAAAAAAGPPPDLPLPTPLPAISLSRKEEAILGTMRSILAFLDKDTLARSTLESTVLSGVPGDNVFHVLQATVMTGRVPKEIAMPLHHSLMSLARSEALFGKLRHSDASSIQLDIGKRKRAEEDEGLQADARPPKRPFVQYDLNAHVIEAVGVVTSVQLQLHHIFLFSVTSAPRGGSGMNALQEIGGLIQVLGVLSGIQIGQNSPTQSTTFELSISWHRLRSHQRIHGVERPFRCEHCPASFARNHDLKRHAKLHDKKAWKCSGCDKIFSRRDAIKRHQNVSRNHGTKGEACIGAMVIEVENDDDEDSAREEKRAKLWNGITTSHSSGAAGETEEGEIEPSVLSALQTTVLTLHPLLQTHVSNALGANALQTAAQPVDAAGSQATLASVIARAQQQNGDSVTPSQSANQSPPQPPTMPSSTAAPASLPAVNRDGENASANHAQPQSLSMFGLSDAQTQMLEQAIAGAAQAAQAQAEAEAALEEEDDDEDLDDDGEYDEDNGEDLELVSIPPAP
ncbi:uncharacterized protein EV420DRAFT_1619131 [Desarmillaria tabescens]|uniref:C2H2-type domain-containing protein n=1 Tax=Armillaria tabescens TaxID=1929756 RepID=A0AA39T3V5_ARMTA|nr:uncharacterized protein EV420DRAFT_1619131 [Desarmillaria tabescens]KAK0462626.1 hypothetical protein EV420DRAFT_1619131 [Desarmillaria tabescens]